MGKERGIEPFWTMRGAGERFKPLLNWPEAFFVERSAATQSSSP
jgi:hypothetical protein